MSVVTTVQQLPPELRFPMLEFAEAIEQKMHSELAVRREDFSALQATVQDLAEAQRRLEQRVDRLETALIELAVAQRRTEQRVEELAEAQRRTEQRVEELAEAQRRTEETLNKLIKRVDRFDSLIGDNLERKYRERAYAYLGQILRPVHSVALQDLLPEIEDQLTDSEVDELLALDVLLRGRARLVEGRPEVWLALEVSATVDRGDVERAVRRAQLLTKAGLRTAPAVAGESITEGAQELAAQQQVLVLQNGRRSNWPQALGSVLTQPPAPTSAAA
jgi:molecular chaperone GrpE (heat shock protein)